MTISDNARQAAEKECQLQYDSPRIRANGGTPSPQGTHVQELLDAATADKDASE